MLSVHNAQVAFSDSGLNFCDSGSNFSFHLWFYLIRKNDFLIVFRVRPPVHIIVSLFDGFLCLVLSRLYIVCREVCRAKHDTGEVVFSGDSC